MKIKEIITETIGEGKVYGWIDSHGQEFQTDATNDRKHHNDVLQHLHTIETPGTEKWNPEGFGRGRDFVSFALRDGWIRIGAVDHEFVFAQLSHKVAKKPLNYLLRIILKFRPNRTIIDLMDDDGQPWNSEDFQNSRQAIAWIRKETGI